MRRQQIHIFLIFLLLAGTIGAATTGKQGKSSSVKKTYVFGVLPFMSHIALYRRFAPLRDYLSRELGAEIILQTSRNFTQHVKQIRKGKYDIVFTAPHFVPVALDSGHYNIIAAHAKPLLALVVVKRDSKIKTIRDLDGKTVSTPPPKALVTIIGKKLLRDTKPDPVMARFRDYPSHNAAYHSVLSGETDAAIVAVLVYKLALKKGLPLRVVGKTPSYPSAGIMASTDLHPSFTRRLTIKLNRMRKTAKGRAVLKKMTFPGFKKVSAADYNSLRKISIPQATHKPQLLKSKP